jgi:uncharacterized protein
MELIYILTYDCNFRCKYCDIDKREEEISDSLLKSSIHFLEKNNFDIDKVKFFWWEPLLKQNYIKYIVNNFPAKYNPGFYTTTNSTLLNEDFITFIKENNFKLTFSIDWDADTTSENRLLLNGSNLSDKVISNTKKYKDYIRVNQVITSKNSSDFFKNFKFIYDLWVREFNFLPEYYREWTKEWLQNLKKWFDEILKFKNNWNNFLLVNLENYSETAFFNLWIVIDTTWKIYWTNLILSGIFEKYKDILEIGDIQKWLKIDINDEKFIIEYTEKINTCINKEYSNNILKSVKYVDLILNNFAYKWNIKD